MYEFADEQHMWSVVEGSPKGVEVIEKPKREVSILEGEKKIVKAHVLQNRNGEHIGSNLIQYNKNKTEGRN